MPGYRADAASMAAMLYGWCSGASGMSARSSSITSGVTMQGRL